MTLRPDGRGHWLNRAQSRGNEGVEMMMRLTTHAALSPTGRRKRIHQLLLGTHAYAHGLLALEEGD